MPAAAKPFRKPRRFDFNLAVIGAGSAGLVSAYIAAASKAKVALVERDRMGGDCLNTGCVPSKALIRSARIASYIQRADEYGMGAENFSIDFAAIMQRVRDVITRIEPHDSVERYSKLGVDCIAGHARVTSPWSLDVGGKSLTARSMIIASGGRPLVPPIPGLEQIDYLTSDTIWSLRARPERFLVLGGGPIGCELAQAFSRLGSQTTIVEMLPRLLVKEDPEVSAALEARFAAENIRVLTGCRATHFGKRGTGSVATCERNGETIDIEFDALLVAVGRRANTDGFGLEEAGVRLNPDGTVAVNDYLQTSRPNIYACGDAAGPYQLTHAAAHQAWYCAMNALFGRFKRFKADYSVIPWAVFTDPEIARVGVSEQEARDQGLDFDITHYGIDDLDRAIADGEAHGFVKLLTARGSDRIVGATIVGHHAGDLIAEYVSAMRNGLGVRKILNTIHIYPTLVEANRYAAGEWQKARLSPRLLRLAERYHRWSRG